MRGGILINVNLYEIELYPHDVLHACMTSVIYEHDFDIKTLINFHAKACRHMPDPLLNNELQGLSRLIDSVYNLLLPVKQQLQQWVDVGGYTPQFMFRPLTDATLVYFG